MLTFLQIYDDSKNKMKEEFVYQFCYLFLLLYMHLMHSQTDVCSPIVIDEKKIIKGEQHLHVVQDINLENVPMKKVISYMMKTPSDKAIASFEHMTLETKLMFLKNMNIRQYEWFLFEVSEQQWRSMWQRLPEDQKKVIPPTVQVQLKMICAVWRACSSGDLFWNPGKNKEADAKDIAFFRDKALRSLRHFKTDDPNDVNMDIKQEVFYQALHNYFQKKKLELLHAL